jgi:hypothetical protein
MSQRYASFADFYPYYLGEHSDPRCRWVHFIGTTGFLGATLACLIHAPLRFGAGLVAALVVGALGARLEARRNAWPVLLMMVGLLVLGNPAVLLGAVSAYAWAWVGHFLIEKNRPATFQYPLWSLMGDFRMYSEMLRGRRWSTEPRA